MATAAAEKRIKDLARFYKKQIESELGTKQTAEVQQISSREYQDFKQSYMPPHLSLYEKLCSFSEKLLQIKPDPKQGALMQENIDIAHLAITPGGALALSFIAPLMIFFTGAIVSYALFQSNFFIGFFLIAALLLIKPIGDLPKLIANSWRMKASNQMVLCVFYVVTYMRHTSNLENALEFASDHLAPPLSLDIKKVLWDVETERFESVKESLDSYLNTWKKWNFEFIESFHLIESSLYEGSEARRLNALDKALDVILTETYEKMLHYAHNLQSPITMLHMLGVILPILGLVILPLMVSFMEGIQWFHIAAIYNIALPFAVYAMGKNILSTRPTGYGQTDISEENPQLRKFRNVILKTGKSEVAINPLFFSVTVAILFLFVGFSPILFHLADLGDFGFGGRDPRSVCGSQFCFLEFREGEGGPFGLGAALISTFVTLALGVGFGLYFKLRSTNVIKIREKSQKLELEFAAALFQLGNRLGDGFPAEIAFQKVADVMEGSISGSFFELVSANIRRMGMSVKRAIFDQKYGALVSFPSNLIESSMKVLIQSIRKGPVIAAQALTNVSRYIKEIHTVNERLKDLMADIISSMNSQIRFMTPAIAGIVIGITSMVTTILGKLGPALESISAGDQTAAVPTFFAGSGIPTYFFQIIVGLYVVQITYILTIMVNGVQNGNDKLQERYLLGKNLINSTILYVLISLVVMFLFNMIAVRILPNVGF